MKIIKKGNPRLIKGIMRFECEHCGAIFEAERQEYKFCPNNNNYGKCWLTTCPCCKERVWA